MGANEAMRPLAADRTRHFDRGFRPAMAAVALLVACSSNLKEPGTTGSAGSNGGAGATGTECGAWSGAGNCASGGTGAGIGGTTGAGGTTGGTGGDGRGGTTGAGATGVGGFGGTGGSVLLPTCTATQPTFGVCFANDTDHSSGFTDSQTSGSATIEAIGSGKAPGACNGGAVGLGEPSDWWIQARAADNRLWTIGVLGLAGSTPVVHVGDTVTLDVDWRITTPVMYVYARGTLQLSDATGTPLLFAASNPSSSTWISFAPGGGVCDTRSCGSTQQAEEKVIATVNGSSMTLPPNGAATIDGYSVGVTYFAAPCANGDYIPSFQAAAVKLLP